MEKMLYVQLVPRSRMAQRFTGSGLKIATDIGGMLGSSEKPLQDPGVRFLWCQDCSDIRIILVSALFRCQDYSDVRIILMSGLF
jgi:hypothetical protein